MKDCITEKVIWHLTTTMGVKPQVVKGINLAGFFATIVKVATLDRQQETLKGEQLTEYKLDSRLKRFVLPRGVYVDSDLLALNFVNKEEYKVNDDEVFSASEFQVVQTQLLGACRKAVSFDSDLKLASEPLTLAEANKRVSFNGMMNYSGETSMPIAIKVNMYETYWYNYPVAEMLDKFVAEVISSLR